MGYLEMALRAMGEGQDRAHLSLRGIEVENATKATDEMKAQNVPEMPAGIKLITWNPMRPPIAISYCAVVNDVECFIVDTLTEIGKTLRSKQAPETSRRLRDLVDTLEQCGVLVQVCGVGSRSGRSEGCQ